MKRYVVAGVALAVFSSAGLASDMPAPRQSYPAYMEPVRGPTVLPFNWGGLYAGLNLGGGFTDVSGIIFGGQVGYNWQLNQIVFGVETDLQVSSQDGGGTVAGFAATHELDWFGTFRGRVGYAVMDRWLPYFTVGLAYGGRNTVIAGAGASDTSIGWAIGVGVDYAINQWWSVRLEYLHLELDGYTGSFAGVPLAVGTLHNDIIRGAVNYKIMH